MKSILVFYTILSNHLVAILGQEETDIIIVGAGASGLAAGVKLLENGINNIIILEAEDRIGGRIHTVDFEGRNIDLGAQWCHGEKGNVVYNILENQNLLYLLKHEEEPGEFYLSASQSLSDYFNEGLVNSMNYAFFDKMVMENQNAEKNLGRLVLKRYNDAITTIFRNDMHTFMLAQMAKEFFHYSLLSDEPAYNWFDVATDDEYEFSEGDQSLGWKHHGYGKFLDILTKKYPNPNEQILNDNKIRLNKEVTKIIINDNNVDILCGDNSTYKTKHVVFTPSLGVLKKISQTLFLPKLPKEKIDAIEKIGFGSVMKVFLKFEKVWWNNLTGFNFIWTERDKRGARRNFPYGPTTSKGESWVVTHFNILAMPKSKILSVWYTGDMVPAIETMEENILRNGIMYTLNLFLGHLFCIPEPQKIIRSFWHKNPHFKGSYSYLSVNSTNEDIRKLQAPVMNSRGEYVLHFAGEATNVLHRSTVHGAVESGFQVANNLTKLYNIYKGRIN